MPPTTKRVQRADADVYVAIAHPVRRGLLDLLAEGDRPVKALTEPFDVSRPAISQHLRVLLDAGVVTEQRHGRERRYRLRPERLREVREWLAKYDRFWQERLESLGQYLEETE